MVLGRTVLVESGDFTSSHGYTTQSSVILSISIIIIKVILDYYRRLKEYKIEGLPVLKVCEVFHASQKILGV